MPNQVLFRHLSPDKKSNNKHIIMKKIVLLLFLVTIIGNGLFAAVKIDTSFVASNKTHLLYYSIPDNYDASKKYPLIVGLHYCGGTAKSYRNSLTPLADSLQAIIVCPDNSANVIPDGQTDIVTAAADSARSSYSIDTTKMYLTGMSCNGEFTLRQGLNKFYSFAGIFPWVPWVSSRNQISVYTIGSDMPTVLAVGTVDPNFGVLMSLYDSLKAEGANINLVLALKIGHQEVFNQFGNTMITCMRYLTSPKTISVGKIEDITLLNTDPAKELSVAISTTGSKELQVNVIVSNDNIVENPTVSFNSTTGKATFSITPKAGKNGTIKVIVEASEKDGPAIGQSVFNVNVDKNTSSSTIEGTPKKLIVSPIPAKNYIKLESQYAITEYKIFNTSGKQLLKGNCPDNKTTIDVSALSKGNYFVVASNINEPVHFCLE